MERGNNRYVRAESRAPGNLHPQSSTCDAPCLLLVRLAPDSPLLQQMGGGGVMMSRYDESGDSRMGGGGFLPTPKLSVVSVRRFSSMM